MNQDIRDSQYLSDIFLDLIWGQILASSQLKNKQKLPKMVFIIPNFLVLQFGENLNKNSKVTDAWKFA